MNLGRMDSPCPLSCFCPTPDGWWEGMLRATLTSRRPMVFRSLFTWTIFFLFTSFLQHGQVFCLEGGTSGRECWGRKGASRGDRFPRWSLLSSWRHEGPLGSSWSLGASKDCRQTPQGERTQLQCPMFYSSVLWPLGPRVRQTCPFWVIRNGLSSPAALSAPWVSSSTWLTTGVCTFCRRCGCMATSLAS